jgi:hypothetical protein
MPFFGVMRRMGPAKLDNGVQELYLRKIKAAGFLKDDDWRRSNWRNG